MAKLKVFRGAGHQQRAAGAAKQGEFVCGVVLEDGEGAAFVMPEGASDAEVRDAAFTIRHGRPVTDSERYLGSLAERMRGRGQI